MTEDTVDGLFKILTGAVCGGFREESTDWDRFVVGVVRVEFEVVDEVNKDFAFDWVDFNCSETESNQLKQRFCWVEKK